MMNRVFPLTLIFAALSAVVVVAAVADSGFYLYGSVGLRTPKAAMIGAE